MVASVELNNDLCFTYYQLAVVKQIKVGLLRVHDYEALEYLLTSNSNPDVTRARDERGREHYLPCVPNRRSRLELRTRSRMLTMRRGDNAMCARHKNVGEIFMSVSHANVCCRAWVIRLALT